MKIEYKNEETGELVLREKFKRNEKYEQEFDFLTKYGYIPTKIIVEVDKITVLLR